MDEDALKKWIKNCEGYQDRLYKDTVGKLTIGYGRNIDDNGISKDEANLMFDNDYNRCVYNLKKYDWYRSQPKNVQCALINMCFNLDIKRLLEFKEMINALNIHDYQKAANEALNSKWANQVGIRAHQISDLIRGNT